MTTSTSSCAVAPDVAPEAPRAALTVGRCPGRFAKVRARIQRRIPMRITVAIACARPDAPLRAILPVAIAQAGEVTVALAAEAHSLAPLAKSLGARTIS